MKAFALAVCFSLSAYAADNRENEIVENLRKNIKAFDGILNEKQLWDDTTKIFAASAKICYLMQLHEKLLNVQERVAILKEIHAHLNDHPTRYGFALRAQWSAAKNNDTHAAIADIVAASKTPKSKNSRFENAAMAIMNQLADNSELGQELLTQFNDLPNNKEKHDVEQFFQSCGLQFVRNLQEEKRRKSMLNSRCRI